MVYRYCLVPLCKSTTVSTPEKTFIKLPVNKNKRKMWLKAARRDPQDVSAKSSLCVCEDHFNLEVDMENYMEWKIMHVHKRMKKDVVPHKFACQVDRKRTWDHSVRNAILKPTRREIIQEALRDRPRTSTDEECTPVEEIGESGDKMTGCAAVDCTNSTAKGFLMKRFPKDPERRKDWGSRVRRSNWSPTDYSVLCEVHFTPDMWEKTRADGSRRLKHNAVPTIFNSSGTKKRVSTVQSKASEDSILNSSESPFCNGHRTVNIPLASETDSSTQTDHNGSTGKASRQDFSDAIPQTATINENPPSPKRRIFNVLTSEQQIEMYQKLVKKSRDRIKHLKNELRKAKNKIKTLEEKQNLHSNENYIENLLTTIFNEDQLMAIKKHNSLKSTKLMKWSGDTIVAALKLKESCGRNGYEQLLNLNLPYPSIRTLERYLQRMKAGTQDNEVISAGVKLEINDD